MKKKGMKKVLLLFIILLMFLLQSSLASAQPQKVHQQQGLFGFQFVMTISGGANETQQPIPPGEVRTVVVQVSYTVVRGAFGNILLHLLEGRPFPLRLSIVDKPVWCTVQLSIEDFIGVISPNVVQEVYSLLSIQLSERAPLNHTLGYVKIHGAIESIKGPFNILTIIQGYDMNATVLFVTSP